MKEVNLLSKGLFNNKLLDSRVKTRAVTRKEKILGHLVGPLGLIFIVNTIAALVEKFFMQQVGLVRLAHIAHKEQAGETAPVVFDIQLYAGHHRRADIPIFAGYNG